MLRDGYLNGVCHVLRKMPVARRTLFRAASALAGSPDRFVLNAGEFKFPVDCGDWDVAVKVALYEAYERKVGALFVSQVTDGSIVVDAGANKGYYSLLSSVRAGPDGKVFAYEPDPRNVDDLNFAKELNGFANFHVCPIALADGPGEASFNLDGWQQKNSAWGKLVRNGEAVAPDQAVTVRTASLDEEIEAYKLSTVDVLKMDIQGGEIDAIPGAKHALEQGIVKSIILELHDMQLSKDECDSIVDQLLSKGYTGRYYDQAEIPDELAARVLRTKTIFPFAEFGEDAKCYDFAKRRATDNYVKPLQFVLHKTS